MSATNGSGDWPFGKQRSRHQLEAAELEMRLAELRADEHWLVIAPDGTVFRDKNPMRAAAIAMKARGMEPMDGITP